MWHFQRLFPPLPSSPPARRKVKSNKNHINIKSNNGKNEKKTKQRPKNKQTKNGNVVTVESNSSAQLHGTAESASQLCYSFSPTTGSPLQGRFARGSRFFFFFLFLFFFFFTFCCCCCFLVVFWGFFFLPLTSFVVSVKRLTRLWVEGNAKVVLSPFYHSMDEWTDFISVARVTE